MLALIALATSCSREAPTATRAPATLSAPAPSSGVGVVDLLRWCWINRNVDRYREVFTGDFEFAFSPSDTIGGPYLGSFTRDDMLISAQHLFVGGSTTQPPAVNISLAFNNDLPMARALDAGLPGPLQEVVEVPAMTLTIATNDGSALSAAGRALFYVVRGDSAVIPQDLLDRGFKPDSTRWFIGRIQDGTSVPPVSGATPAQAASLPTLLTWGRLLLLYRQ